MKKRLVDIEPKLLGKRKKSALNVTAAVLRLPNPATRWKGGVFDQQMMLWDARVDMYYGMQSCAR